METVTLKDGTTLRIEIDRSPDDLRFYESEEQKFRNEIMTRIETLNAEGLEKVLDCVVKTLLGL